MSETDRNVILGMDTLIHKFDALDEELQGEVLENAAKAGGIIIINAAKENIQKQGLIKTRNLSRSVHQEVVESTPTSATVAIGTDVEYAAIHEFGGVIRAKKGKYLAIPVNGAKGSPLDRSDLHFHLTGNGKPVLADESGQIQFVLKESVEIPPRPYLRPALDEHHLEAMGEVAEVFRQQIKKAATK